MTTFELYFCATLLRGALAVLFLLGAESLLRHRLSTGLRRLLWAGCILLLLVPRMNFSALHQQCSTIWTNRCPILRRFPSILLQTPPPNRSRLCSPAKVQTNCSAVTLTM